ncbi:hypothetical protein ACIGHG_23500 [Bacillus sp. NPDC077411]|uniref:hypothetical protein n=1 Tax=Bacillus sp. NPDC077411 TaxID=3363947 RepID=UPI0037C70F64
MGNAGRSTIDITADDRQARRTYSNFFDYIERAGRRVEQRMRNFNPIGAIEREVQRSSQNIGRPIRNLPDHLRGFDAALNATRIGLRETAREGVRSFDELANAAVRNRVSLDRMMSANSSGKSAARSIQELTAHVRETQLAVMGLNHNGTARISTEQAQAQLRRFQSEVANTRRRLEELRDAGDFSSYESGMRVLEHQMAQVDRAMRAAAQGGHAYNSMINQLGVHTQDAANRATIAMEAYRESFMRSVEHMNAMKTQSQKMMDALGDTSRIQRIDRAFLQVGDRLERMARSGTAANIALRQLGPNASMKDLMDRIRLINTGLMRMQQVAMVAGVALAGFTAVMAKASIGPDPAEIRKQQADITKIYEDELQKRTDAIYNASNIFKEMKIEPVKSEFLTKNLDEQVGIYKRWVDNMKNLSGRIPVEMKEELYKMGPEAAGEIKALRDMSEPELAHYVELWKEKHKLAREAALDELGRLREETKQKIKELEDSLKPLGIAWEKFKSTWAEALAPFVEIWGELAAVVVDAGTKVGEFINKLNELNPDIVKLIGMFAYLFTAFTVILAPMAIGIGRAQGMRAAFTLLWTTISPLVLGFLRIAGMASLVSAALVILGGTIMKLWKHSELFRNSIVNGWEQIKSTVLDAIDPLTSKFQELLQAFLTFINALVGNEGTSSTESFWKGLGDAIGKVINLLVQGLIPVIKFLMKIWTTEISLVIDGITAVLKALTYVIDKVKEFSSAISAIWSGNDGKATSILERLGFSPEATKDIINSINDIKKNVFGLYEKLQQGAETAKKYVDALFAAFKGDTTQTVKLLESLGLSDQEIQSFLKAIENVKKAFKEFITFLKNEILPNFLSFFKDFSRIVGDLLGVLFQFIGGFAQFLTALLSGDWNGVVEGVKTMFSAFSQAVKLNTELLGSLLKLLFKNLWALLPDSMTDPIEKAVQKIQQWYNDTIKFFEDLPGNTKAKLNEWGNNIETFFNELPGKARNKLDTWKTDISNWFSDKASDIKKDLETWWVEMGNWFDSIPSKISAKLVSWKEAITQWFKEQNDENIKFYEQLWNSMSEWFSSIPDKLKSQLSEWGTAISSWFDETVSLWGDNLEKWWNGLVSWFDETTSRWGEQLEKWWSSIVTWWTTLPDRMKEQLENWWSSISSWFDETTSRWAENLEKWWSSITDWFSNAPSRIKEQLGTWWSSISNWFSETASNWQSSLETWWTEIKNWFSGLATKPEIKGAATQSMDEMKKGYEEKKPEIIDKLGEVIVDAFIAILEGAGIIALAVGKELLQRFINGLAGEQKNAEITADTIGKAVLGIFENINLFSAAVKIIREFGNGIEDTFGSVRDTISGWIDKIKSLFDFNLKLPKIELPELPRLPQPKIVGDFSLMPPSVPSIEWHRKGGIFNKATVIGLGEAGKEAALPLVGNAMDPFADAVFNRLAARMKIFFDKIINQLNSVGNVDSSAMLGKMSDAISGSLQSAMNSFNVQQFSPNIDPRYLSQFTGADPTAQQAQQSIDGQPVNIDLTQPVNVYLDGKSIFEIVEKYRIRNEKIKKVQGK